jgi:hypothetical protein
MELQSVYEPIKRSKGASSNPTPWTRDPHATRQKTVRPVEADASYFSSAFLAERGCLSQEKSRKLNAA